MLKGKSKILKGRKPRKPGVIETKYEYFNPEKLRLAKIDAGTSATPDQIFGYYLRRAGYAKENGVVVDWTTWKERLEKSGGTIPPIKKPTE